MTFSVENKHLAPMFSLTLRIYLPSTLFSKYQISVLECLRKEITFLPVPASILSTRHVDITQEIKSILQARVCVYGVESVPCPVLVFTITRDTVGVVVAFEDFRTQVVRSILDAETSVAVEGICAGMGESGGVAVELDMAYWRERGGGDCGAVTACKFTYFKEQRSVVRCLLRNLSASQ
jgi:hypothetical protein